MLTAAAIVLVVTALLHSGLGEVMLFRRLGKDGLPELGFPPVVGRQSSLATLRATWHTPSILAVALAAIVFRFGTAQALDDGDRTTLQLIAGLLAACSILWCAATRARHLGWLFFGAAAVLAWLGAR